MRKLLGALVTSTFLLAACGGSDVTEEEAITNRAVPTIEETENGYIKNIHINDDGRPDVFKVFEYYPNPDDPSVRSERLRERKVDVNFDGKINNHRFYNEKGDLVEERIDMDLDGQFDVIAYFDNNMLVRKETVDPEEDGRVVAVRFYEGDQIAKVERDTTGDGKIDQWEFYEQGVLDRVGRDLNADGRADTWQTR